MILIAHRGNTDGAVPDLENSPAHVDLALKKGFDAEVDLWFCKDNYWLGHDTPDYKVSEEWLYERHQSLWIHCKNLAALEMLHSKEEFNYFWHEKDTVTLTSQKVIWAHSGTQPIKNSVAVMPTDDEDLSSCSGICSDDVERYKR
jgi:hypothetical protein